VYPRQINHRYVQGMAHIRLVQNRAKVSGNKTSDSEHVHRKVLSTVQCIKLIWVFS